MILVTGATGYVGGRALRLLSAAGRPVVAMARDAQRAGSELPSGIDVRIADYDDRSSLEKAFEGVTGLLFIASDGDGDDVMRQHANVIDAAATANVGHVVFTGIIDVDEASPFYFAPVYRDAEQGLVEAGLCCTILRCGLYADFVLSNWIEPALSTGQLSLPVGQARIAPIARDDVAAAVVAALVSGRPAGILDLTGPAAYSLDEVARLASRYSGVPIRYLNCSPADYLERMAAEMPDHPWPQAFPTLCESIAEGRYGRVSADAETLLGRPVEGLDAFFRRKLKVD